MNAPEAGEQGRPLADFTVTLEAHREAMLLMRELAD